MFIVKVVEVLSVIVKSLLAFVCSSRIHTSGDCGVPDCEAVAVVMVIVGNWQLAMLCCSRGHQILCKL